MLAEECRRQHQHMGLEILQRIQQLVDRARLANNANIVFGRECTGHPNAKYSLVVSQDYIDHVMDACNYRAAMLSSPENLR